MADQMRISGPVEVEPTAKEFVAFKLLEKIANQEEGRDRERGTREYWLTLYRQCYKAADGQLLKHILDGKES